MTTIEKHRHAVFGDLLHHLVHALAGMVTISVDQPWFAEHVDLIAFDEEMAFATSSATVAFKLRHSLSVLDPRSSASCWSQSRKPRRPRTYRDKNRLS